MREGMCRERIVSLRATSEPVRSSAGWGSCAYRSRQGPYRGSEEARTVKPFSFAVLTTEENVGPEPLTVENWLKI